eukprot:TRINITY_DN5095_c0_g2_i1.p1 TRINITY_DN5095_c0_g2~~TRINITY_DN5095_c0_g2_i1.p1  ORF type:complete len:645 (+),score=78.81 TRINITY_DN5095_c0_g2_i1:167-1936(+)
MLKGGSNQGQVRCGVCGLLRTHQTVREWGIHVSNHLSAYDERSTSSDNKDRRQLNRVTTKVQCAKCKFWFEEIEWLIRHLEIYHSGYRYQAIWEMMYGNQPNIHASQLLGDLQTLPPSQPPWFTAPVGAGYRKDEAQLCTLEVRPGQEEYLETLEAQQRYEQLWSRIRTVARYMEGTSSDTNYKHRTAQRNGARVTSIFQSPIVYGFMQPFAIQSISLHEGEVSYRHVLWQQMYDTLDKQYDKLKEVFGGTKVTRECIISMVRKMGDEEMARRIKQNFTEDDGIRKIVSELVEDIFAKFQSSSSLQQSQALPRRADVKIIPLPERTPSGIELDDQGLGALLYDAENQTKGSTGSSICEIMAKFSLQSKQQNVEGKVKFMGLPPEMMMAVMRFLMVADVSALGKLRCTCQRMRELGKLFFLKSELPKSRVSGDWQGLYPERITQKTPLLLMYESAQPKVGFYLPVSIANLPFSQKFEADLGSQNGNGNEDGQDDAVGIFDVRLKFGNFVGVVAKILSEGMPDVFKFMKPTSTSRKNANANLAQALFAAPAPPPPQLQQPPQQQDQEDDEDDEDDLDDDEDDSSDDDPMIS